MSRIVTVGAAQLGPIVRDEPRESAVARMIALMERAASRGCDLVVFPELALTTFFPRWYLEDQAEVDVFFEREMPNEATRPLFDAAARLGEVAIEERVALFLDDDRRGVTDRSGAGGHQTALLGETRSMARNLALRALGFSATSSSVGVIGLRNSSRKSGATTGAITGREVVSGEEEADTSRRLTMRSSSEW